MPNESIMTWYPIEGTLRRRANENNENPELPAGAVGALPVGEAEYSIPANAIFVSPSGNNANGGTESSPVQTVARAAQLAEPNDTIVLRAGEYHEGGTYEVGNNASLAGVWLDKRGLTLQNYPGEEVWFDGSQVVTGWVAAGAGRWSVPFVTGFDRTETNTRGVDGSTWPGDEPFVNASFPYASWPEQVFVDGQPLEHVGSINDVGPGTFFVQGSYQGGTGTHKNHYTSTHYIIGENPAGKEVRIGTKSRAIQVKERDITLRGIGLRRYNAALCEFGTIYLDGYDANAGFRMENVVVRDVSNEGLHSLGTNAVVANCSFIRCGSMGIGGNSDDTTIERCYFKENVSRRYNYGPASGAIKFMYGHRLTLRDNLFEDTYGPGFWADGSVYDAAIYRNDFIRCWGNGIGWEISAKVYIVDNLFVDTSINSDIRPPYQSFGLWLSGSDNIYVWNNTFVNAEKHIHMNEDSRDPFNPDNRYGYDHRRPVSFYETEMKWSGTTYRFFNNVFYGAAGLNQIQSAFYSTSASSRETSAYDIQTGGNLYSRLDTTRPARFANGYQGGSVGWFSMTGASHTGGPSWASITGETGSQFVSGRDVMSVANGTSYVVNPSEASAVSLQPMPAEVASRVGRSAGVQHLGAWRGEG